MSFNPKAKSIAEIPSKDVSKRSLKKLSRKFNSPDKMAPFFIKTDHKFSDGKEGPLFIFGKIRKFRNEIRPLKGPTELHGLAYVEISDEGSPVLCLAPTRGKLANKTMNLRRAMRAAFTSAYANFRLLDPIAEKAAQAAEEAVEAMEDEFGDELADEIKEAVVDAKKDRGGKVGEQAKTESESVQVMREAIRKLEEIVRRMKVNVNEAEHVRLDKQFKQTLVELKSRY